MARAMEKSSHNRFGDATSTSTSKEGTDTKSNSCSYSLDFLGKMVLTT